MVQGEWELPRGAGKLDRLPAAAWTDPATLSADWSYDPYKGGILLGYDRGKPIGSRDDRHLLTVAGSRAGKGVSLMIPNLLLYEGSVLAIDPKGELASITCRARREMGQRCYVLDPFEANGRHDSASYNPLVELDRDSPTLIDDAGILAEALVVGSDKDSHWTDNARRLLKMLILFVVDQNLEGETHLGQVRDLLMLTDPLVKAMAKATGSNLTVALFDHLRTAGDAAHGVIRGEAEAFASLMSQSEREFGSILSTARTQTEFLDSPPLRRILERSDFRMEDLKRDRVTVYLCLPSTRLGSHFRWLRVMINMLLASLEKTKHRPALPVVMLLEEFAQLGHMREIEKAAGLMAGFSVRLWTVLQDLAQLQNAYQGSWETFIGNAGAMTFFGNPDMTTLRYITQKLGTTVMRHERGARASMPALAGGASPLNEEFRETTLLQTDEVERLFARETGKLLVLSAGARNFVLDRISYYEDPNFEGLFDTSTT